MAKYTITHTCGHETEAQLFGKNQERQRRIAQMEQYDCPACRAKAANSDSSLPTLTGSAKQVAWASDIRAKIIRMGLGEYVINETSAGWWIDNQYRMRDIVSERRNAKNKNRTTNMSNSEIFRAAHAYTRKMKQAHPEIDYHAQFALTLKAAYAMIAEAKAA